MLSTLLLLCAAGFAAGSESDFEGQLVHLQILGTNGFHAPLQLYPGDPNQESDWPDGMAKLTQLGMRQQFELGKAIRQQYHSFITSDPREVEVFSSCEDRSVQSILCLLASLYAPSKEWRFAAHFNWQPIPVTWADGRYDKYVGYDAYCPKLMLERQKIFESHAAQSMMRRNEFFCSYWSNWTGIEMSHWNDVAALYDTLSREEAAGLEIPPWAREFWHEMKKITDIAYKWNVNSKASIRRKIGALLDVIVDRMRAKTLEDDPNPQIKVNVYMTHDWNLAAFLASLFQLEEQPPPSATVCVELWRHFDTHMVRLVYFDGSGDMVTLRVHGCGDYCPLAYVVNYFQDYVTKDWPKACGLRLKEKGQPRDESGRPFSLSN